MVLISTYELGRQPFGLASPAAWLKEAGASVSVQDLAVQCGLDPAPIRDALLVGVHVPMHTATRLAESVLERVRELNGEAHVAVYGLYAPMNEDRLRALGADTILGGEFEEGVTDVYRQLVEEGARSADDPQRQPVISLSRQSFKVPDRSGLPPLERYAKLQLPSKEERVVGYTEASRGCKHLCRHCPIVPVYNGRFRVVQRDTVLQDIRGQVEMGAEHITFGDPDFLNAPTHSLEIVRRAHEEFPTLTYDATIKIEHLRKRAHVLPELKATGCVLVTSAVESVTEEILERFDKGHTREDVEVVAEAFGEIGLALNPTFVPFTPWTRPEDYAELLDAVAEMDLVDNVSPIQYAIRLLIPSGSRLLELPEIEELIGRFDPDQLCYPWAHPNPQMDRLQEGVLGVVTKGQTEGVTRRGIFRQIWQLAHSLVGSDPRPEPPALEDVAAPVTIPYLTEPWYC